MEKEKVLNAEKETISLMLALYCRDKHGRKEGLCEECRELELYA